MSTLWSINSSQILWDQPGPRMAAPSWSIPTPSLLLPTPHPFTPTKAFSICSGCRNHLSPSLTPTALPLPPGSIFSCPSALHPCPDGAKPTQTPLELTGGGGRGVPYVGRGVPSCPTAAPVSMGPRELMCLEEEMGRSQWQTSSGAHIRHGPGPVTWGRGGTVPIGATPGCPWLLHPMGAERLQWGHQGLGGPWRGEGGRRGQGGWGGRGG